jgi:hypothetical protein
LHFKRIRRQHTVKYQAVGKKNGSCADYQTTKTMPSNNVQLKPILVVDPNGVKSCR